MNYLIGRYGVDSRQACRCVKLHRSVYYYSSRMGPLIELRQRMRCGLNDTEYFATNRIVGRHTPKGDTARFAIIQKSTPSKSIAAHRGGCLCNASSTYDRTGGNARVRPEVPGRTERNPIARGPRDCS